MQLVAFWKRAVLANYANFSGRDARPEYWWFILANAIIATALNIVGLDMISSLWSLAMLIPSLAAGTRRLHDTGRSGWWHLIALIPLVGFIILLVWLASEGKGETNQYGAPAGGASSGSLTDPPLPPPPPPVSN